MTRKGAKDDSKGLDKLFKLAVLGSALIVIVYSVYYYSNAYKHSSSNIYYAFQEDNLNVETLDAKLVVSEKNVVFSNNQLMALSNGLEGWKLSNATNKEAYTNSRTTVGASGMVAEGFSESFMNELIKKFQNVPPVLLANDSGITVRSIQFEHFIFPYHAMVNWRDESKPYKTFSFYTDSLPGELTLGENGLLWFSGQHGEYLKIQMCNAGDSLSAIKNRSIIPSEFEMVEMPIVDFDVIYRAKNQLGMPFENGGSKSKVVESEGELKILIGPSLKQNNVYEIDGTGKKVLEIKPPFFVELGKEKGAKPYFYALITDEKLLLH